MEKMSTREKILEESMKLFSIYGFEAVSIRTIAAKVGVRDSALYKHFKSKQEIFDTIVGESKKRFYDQYKKVLSVKKDNFDFTKMCIDMYEFQTENEWIVEFRRMLILEQFKDQKMADTFKELFIDMPVNNMTRIFSKLIEEGIMKDNNPKVMAIELYSPFFMYHTVTEDKKELRKIFIEHAEYFANNYFLMKP